MAAIRNLTRGSVLATDARMADTYFTRLKGLLFRTGLDPGEALVITPCNSVHMFGMLFSLDVVFCDADKRVLKTVAELKPFRATWPLRGAIYAIEMNPGSILDSLTSAGDTLEF